MDYQVSARKFRPGTFAEVIGQPHVVQTLSNAIASQRLAHAFLFSGTRGVGKTTVARILAKALNCERGPTSTPCETCDNCAEITQGTSVDVIEIDGASNTGVDDVREIRENVKFTPFRGKYRVYIIDEVHMLSNSAFNALLKTLEEPPAHVVFIFATTEIHKIPGTILSRCQHYNFRRIPRIEIIAQLRHVADQDGLTIEDRSLAAMARASEGSMRDALSLLDQAVAFGGKALRHEDLETLLGAVPQEHVRGMIGAIRGQDSQAALQVIAAVLDQGHDLRAYCAELVERLRNLLVAAVVLPSQGSASARDAAQQVKALKGLMDLSDDELRQIAQDALVLSPDSLQEVFRVFSHVEDALRLSTHPRFILEVAAIKATRLHDPDARSTVRPDPSPPVQPGGPRPTPGPASAPSPSRQAAPPKAGGTPASDKISPAPPPGESSSVTAAGVVEPPLDPTPAPPTPATRTPSPAPPRIQAGSRPATQQVPAASSPKTSAPQRPISWDVILDRVDASSPSLGPFLAQGTLMQAEDGLIVVGYPPSATVARGRVEKPESLNTLRAICAELAGRPIRVQVQDLREGLETAPSMAELRAAQQRDRKDALVIKARAHPLVKQAFELFGAEVAEIRQPTPQEDPRS